MLQKKYNKIKSLWWIVLLLEEPDSQQPYVANFDTEETF